MTARKFVPEHIKVYRMQVITKLVPETDFLRPQVSVQQSNAPFTNESRFRQIHFRTFRDRDVGRLVAKTNALSGQNSTLT
jgi:hypothetical protein